MTHQPEPSCTLCERLVAFRSDNSKNNPDWHNAPVPSFGSIDAALLIVGLAPGLKGANRTGRPFTGDYAGDLLYPSLLRYDFAEGTYGAVAKDTLSLTNSRITNAVRCVPPANKPTGPEIKTCRSFLTNEITAMPNLRAIMALGRVAHQSVIAALGEKQSQWPFSHGGTHQFSAGFRLFDSYHCSRYNTNTGRLTPEMFHDVIASIRQYLAEPA